MVKLRPVLFWDGLDWACDEVLRDQKKLDGPQMGKIIISLHPHFFLLTVPWVLALGYSEQGVFNALRQTLGLMLPRGC